MQILSVLLSFFIIPTSLNAVGLPSAENFSPPADSCTNPGPVTDACIEAGLRKQREVLRQLPEFRAGGADVHMKLAQLLMQQGDPNGAIEEYQAVIQLKPESAEAYRNLGAVFLDKHDWWSAEKALQTAARINAQDGQTFYWLGRSLLAQQKFQDAEEAFLTATSLNSTDAEAFSDMALACMAQGHSSDAARALQQAIRLMPDFSEAHHRLEITNAFLQDRELLIQETTKILEILFRRE